MDNKSGETDRSIGGKPKNFREVINKNLMGESLGDRPKGKRCKLLIIYYLQRLFSGKEGISLIVLICC